MATPHDHPEESSQKEIKTQLQQMFKKMPEEIPVVLFARPGKNDVFADAARQALQYFAQLTDKIVFREFDLDHKQAKKWKVSHSPTLLIAPEKYAIRWLGAPVGEEGRIFLEAILYVGFGQTGISGASRKVLDQIKDKRHIKLFVSPSCPTAPPRR